MIIQEIPLTADNQQFSIVLGGVTWQISIIWRDLYWIMDLQNDRGEPVISGIPLVTGADLLAQYACMGLGFKLVVVCDDNTQDYPSKTDMGGTQSFTGINGVSMSQNWMRHFELQLVDGNGQGIELSDFKVTFTIDWFNISSASRVGTIKIYNLSADTVNRITGQEFSKVRLIAGYDGIAPEVAASDVGTVREVDAADVGQSDGTQLRADFQRRNSLLGHRKRQPY